MTKVSGDSNQNTKSSYEGNIDSKSSGEVKGEVREGAECTFDKLKVGAKAVGKKIADPDRSLEDEDNREKS